MDHALKIGKENESEWFGGIDVIFAGDLYQYPPVAGVALYTPISRYCTNAFNWPVTVSRPPLARPNFGLGPASRRGAGQRVM